MFRSFSLKVLTLISVLFITWLAGSVYVVYSAPKLTFKTAGSKNQDYGIPISQDFVVNKANKKVEIINIPNSNSKEVLIYFHGNAGRLTEILKQATTSGVVVSPAYPGFSASEGNPTSENVYETVDLTMRYLFNKGYKEEQITILGHSLGGSPAVYAASKYPNLKKVIVVNTFLSMRSICEIHYYIFCALGDNFLNTEKLAVSAKAKIRQFHNINDQTVPFNQGLKLFQKLGSKDKKFQEISGDHVNFNINYVLSFE